MKIDHATGHRSVQGSNPLGLGMVNVVQLTAVLVKTFSDTNDVVADWIGVIVKSDASLPAAVAL